MQIAPAFTKGPALVSWDLAASALRACRQNVCPESAGIAAAHTLSSAPPWPPARAARRRAEEKNEKCMLNIMDAAFCIGARSIALPVLGQDPYHDFAVKTVAEIMIYQIIECCHLDDTGNLNKIVIANDDP